MMDSIIIIIIIIKRDGKFAKPQNT